MTNLQQNTIDEELQDFRSSLKDFIAEAEIENKVYAYDYLLEEHNDLSKSFQDLAEDFNNVLDDNALLEKENKFLNIAFLGMTAVAIASVVLHYIG